MSRSIRRRAVLAAVLPATLAAVLLPAAAEAGTVQTLPDGTLLYDDKSSRERNNVAMRSVNGTIVISDTAPIVSATSQCKVFNGDLECSSAPRVRVILGSQDDRIEYRLPHEGLVQMGDGNDTVVGGVRDSAGQAIQPVTYLGEQGFDTVSYATATSGVTVDMADNLANDGRAGDRENLASGFEFLSGSSFRDTLFGTPGPDGIAGGGDRDVIAGGAGDDFFYSSTKDGADDYHGGPGRDGILYVGRTQPLTVQLDNVATDGEAGEFDNVRSNVEDIVGGAGADTLNSFGAFSRLEGLGGADTLIGGDGPDTLIGGAGRDSIEAGSGNDIVDARDGEPDFVDCGAEADTLSRDAGEGVVRSCETVGVGVLRLADKAIDAEAGKAAPVTLSWRHPDAWRKLRSVTLRLTHDGVAVGEVTVHPRSERIEAAGVVKVARRDTRLTRRGKTVTARLALRIDASMTGQELGLEVEATDKQGRRQLERDAATIRVAK